MVLSILILLGGLVTAFVLHAIWQWRRLSHVPGPFIAGFSKLWVFWEAIQLRLPAAYEEVGKQYGESSLTSTTEDIIPARGPPEYCPNKIVSDRVTRARRPQRVAH